MGPGRGLQEFGDQVTRARNEAARVWDQPGKEATRVWGSGHKSLGMRSLVHLGRLVVSLSYLYAIGFGR